MTWTPKCTSSDDNVIESDSGDEDENQALDDFYNRVTRGEIDLNTIMASATHAEKSKGVDPAHLSKIWKIDLKMAERTLNVVSQFSKRTDNPKLSRNYDTNDRMLRYRWFTEYFLWIRSSPLRRLASRREVTPVASCSLLIRDLSTSFP